jgi:AraC-like DNA-binding protein
VLPRRGHFCWHQGRRRWQGTPGGALLVGPGSECRVEHPCVGGDECTVLCLPEAMARAWLGERAALAAAPLAVATAGALHLQHLQHLQLLCAARGGADPLELDERCTAILAGLSALAPATSSADGRGPQAQAAQRDLAHAAAEILARAPGRTTLAELTAELACSPFHLVRAFRREFGVPPHRYHVRLRLRAAVAALAEGARDLTAQALAQGFADHAHFTRAFRAEFGCPPSAARDVLSKDVQAAARRGGDRSRP